MEFFSSLETCSAGVFSIISNGFNMGKLFSKLELLCLVSSLLPIPVLWLLIDNPIFLTQNVLIVKPIIIIENAILYFSAVLGFHIFYYISSCLVALMIASKFVEKDFSWRSKLRCLPKAILPYISLLPLYLINQVINFWVTLLIFPVEVASFSKGIWVFTLRWLAIIVYYFLICGTFTQFFVCLGHLSISACMMETTHLWGMSALGSSFRLLKGNFTSSSRIVSIYFGCTSLIGFGLKYLINSEAHILIKVAVSVIIVPILSSINLLGFLTQNVSYFVLKNKKNQLLTREQVKHHLQITEENQQGSP